LLHLFFFIYWDRVIWVSLFPVSLILVFTITVPVIQGNDIPLNALILSVPDTYDDMVYGENPVFPTEALDFIQYAGIYS
ncbi:hypothetical protein, partial [Propionispora hippei]